MLGWLLTSLFTRLLYLVSSVQSMSKAFPIVRCLPTFCLTDTTSADTGTTTSCTFASCSTSVARTFSGLDK